MSIVRDDFDERQTRVDRMIAEFRNAQSRRLPKENTLKPGTLKSGDGVVESQRGPDEHRTAGSRVNVFPPE
jgi:hypothetical protein